MGNVERKRIVKTIDFVKQLEELNINTACLQACLLAMGAKDIGLDEVIERDRTLKGIENIEEYMRGKGLDLALSLEMDKPISLEIAKKMLLRTKEYLVQLNYKYNSNVKINGVLFAFGDYEKEPAHVVGVLPRDKMTRNVRKIIRPIDAHVVVDTSRAYEPVYLMSTRNIAENLNAFILNGISVSVHVVTEYQ